ncbi:Uncharacterised protein [Mycobacteroides abscessus subsp. abscessus]|nr:Uncharacterised protein [Mycobacteroides abscessus subsp. abscessus]
MMKSISVGAATRYNKVPEGKACASWRCSSANRRRRSLRLNMYGIPDSK